jgi:hypothetical protein
MYRRHDIWKRVNEDEVVCYWCFEDLDTGMFFVQNKDYFRRSGNLTTQVQQAEARVVDLIGREIEDRATFDTLLKAIEAHENLWGQPAD